MPTNLTKLIFYFILTLSPFTWASEPSGAPILRIETEMHTDRITQISVDAKERFLLTASEDKTLRLWDLTTGKFIMTYRVPIGAIVEGILYAGAISPDDELIAGGGWTGGEWEQNASIYLFNRINGNLVKRLYGLPNTISHLCFSPDGQYLAASLGDLGIRIWETKQWGLVFSDTQYEGSSPHCVFDANNRLLTTDSAGYLRLYSLSNNNFVLTVQQQVPEGKNTDGSTFQRHPEVAEFSPSGDKIAVGFSNTRKVLVFDGNTLEYLFETDTKDISSSKRNSVVAWSPDGQRLCAGGTHDNDENNLIRCWLEGGQGSYTDLVATHASNDVIITLHFLNNGDLVYGTQPPSWGILDSTGENRLEKQSYLADYFDMTTDQSSSFLISPDGSIVQFELEQGGSRCARFSLVEQKLSLNLPDDNTLLPPSITGLNITKWWGNTPKLDDKSLSFPPIGSIYPESGSDSLAIAPDQSSFLLGTCCALRLFDVQGQQKWGVPISGTAWAVNISGDGQKAVAALGDGTIRWYNLSNGEELVTLFPHNDGKRWIAWTPSGYYMSSGEDADELLGWHVNHGKDQAASFYPVGQKYSKTYKRPEVVQKTLSVLSEKKALEELYTENTPNEPDQTPILRIEAKMHTARINRFDTYESDTDSFLVTASDDKTLRKWDLATGKSGPIYRVPIGGGSEGQLYSVAVSPDGKWIAGAGNTGATWEKVASIYVFDSATGQIVNRLSNLPAPIMHLCFSPDGQYLAASLAKEGIRMWETQYWEQIFSDTEYTESSQSCEFDAQNRLLTTSWDGYLRLYSVTSGSDEELFALVTKAQPPGGKQPFHAVFSPEALDIPAGSKIAVGFNDSTQVNVLDGQTLAFLYAPDTSGFDNGNLVSVALGASTWKKPKPLVTVVSRELCVGGGYNDEHGRHLIRCWSEWGQDSRYTDLEASDNTITQIRFQKNRLVYSSTEPSWGSFTNVGSPYLQGVERVEHVAPIADYRDRTLDLPSLFSVSYDASVVDFNFSQHEGRPARFFLNQQRLSLYPPPDSSLQPADTSSLNITDWRHNPQPKLNGTVLPLEENEVMTRSLAIAPDKSSFLLGTEHGLYLFSVTGQSLWTIPAPSVAWQVNISGDGQKAIAALGDGTIRWYNLANGEELLAFFPHIDGKRWIAWTPSGYYMNSGADADKLLGWHKNQGKDQAAEILPISAFQAEFNRPDIVKKVLVTLTEDKAVLVANLEKNIDATPLKTQSQRWEEIKEKYQVNLTPSGLGKAIIVAASGPQGNKNTLFYYTNQFTERMYNFLQDHGFSDGDVIYIDPYPPAVPSGNYEDSKRQDFPLHDPLKELEQAFDDAARDLKSGQQFIFYLHGHAGYQTIRLRLGQESETSIDLSAQQLKEQLAKIPKGVTQIIILDTCHSGLFLAELAGVPDRIVVTSADRDSLAWTSDKGKSFADTFIQKLSFGVMEAFKMARKTILDDPKLFDDQRPQLDDNQDGQYIEGEDGQLANNTYIGGNKVSASVPPVITEVHPAIYLDPQETTATLWVKTSVDLNTVNKVQAILTNENDKPTEYQGEQTQFTRREITLTPNYELQRFETEYSGFQAATEWRIFYQVETIEGQWSDFEVGFVRTDTDETSATVKAIVNQPVYQIGDPFRFEVMIAGEGNFDLYVGFRFPHGDYATIDYPFSFSAMNELLPYQKNLTLAKEGQTFTILNFGLGLPAIELGEYQACALLTKANSDPNENSNWVKLDCQGFRF